MSVNHEEKTTAEALILGFQTTKTLVMWEDPQVIKVTQYYLKH